MKALEQPPRVEVDSDSSLFLLSFVLFVARQYVIKLRALVTCPVHWRARIHHPSRSFCFLSTSFATKEREETREATRQPINRPCIGKGRFILLQRPSPIFFFTSNHRRRKLNFTMQNVKDAANAVSEKVKGKARARRRRVSIHVPVNTSRGIQWYIVRSSQRSSQERQSLSWQPCQPRY